MLIKISTDGADILWQLRYVIWKSQCDGWDIEKLANHDGRRYCFEDFHSTWAKHWDQFVCLFVCLSFDRMARAVKWFLGNGRGGAMVCKPEPCSLGQAFRAYWTLAREERPSGIRGLHWLEGKEWFPHLCGCRSFITFLSVRWINCMAARLKWQGLWRRQKASQVEWCCLTWEWLRTSLLSPSGG